MTNVQEAEIMQKFTDTFNSINDKLTTIQQTLDKNGQFQSGEKKVSVAISLEDVTKDVDQGMKSIFNTYKGELATEVNNAITEGFEKLMNKFNEVMGQIKDTISTQSKEGFASMKQTFGIFEKSF